MPSQFHPDMDDALQTFEETKHWRLNYRAQSGAVYLAQDGDGDAASLIELCVSQLPDLASALLALHSHAVKNGFAVQREGGIRIAEDVQCPSEVRAIEPVRPG